MGAIDKKISELEELITPAVNDLLAIVDVSVADFQTKYITTTNLVTGGIIAPADPQYVTLAVHAGLPNERVLTGTANQVIVTDGGAGGAVTLSTPQDIAITSVPQFDGMTLTGQLFIDGGADEVQLRVQANATQSAGVNIMTIEDSAGNVLAGADERGVLFSDGNTAISNVMIGNDAGNVAGTYTQSIVIGYQAGIDLTSGGNNVIIGYQAGYENQTGADNVLIGYHAGLGVAGNSFINNVFIGSLAGRDVTTGGSNVGIGHSALVNIEDGTKNMALGSSALYSCISGQYNVAVGADALRNTTSSYNVAVGQDAGEDINSGEQNTIVGYAAANASTTANFFTAIGYRVGYIANASAYVGIGHNAFRFLDDGAYGVAVGFAAGYSNTTAAGNIYIGRAAGYFNQTGEGNVCIGYQAGYGVAANSHTNNTFIGYQSGLAVTTGSNNILLGYKAGDVLTTGGSNIIIGYDIDPTANNVSNQLNIGGLIYGNIGSAQVGVNVTPPSLAASFHVDQPAADGAEPVLLLDQADIDYVLMKIIGTAEAASADRTLVADSDYGTPGALVGWVQVEVQDDGNRIADSDYYIPFYAVPT